jgi:hypothetical protein
VPGRRDPVPGRGHQVSGVLHAVPADGDPVPGGEHAVPSLFDEMYAVLHPSVGGIRGDYAGVPGD